VRHSLPPGAHLGLALASTLAGCNPAGAAPALTSAPPAPAASADASPRQEPTETGGAQVPSVPRQGITDVAVGHAVTCLRLVDGTVRCAGANTDGRAGLGDALAASTPTIVSGLPSALAIAVGDVHGCALDTEGRVHCWGGNEYGQLGDGTTTSRGAAAIVEGLEHVVEIDAARSHTCARHENGTVSCWGRALHVGDGSEETRTRPVMLTGIRDAISITLGPENGCVILADHTARCWGFNGGGVFGSRPGPFRRPVSVFEVPVREIALGDRHVCVVLDDGHLECAGSNEYGQLADQPVPDEARCQRDDNTLTCSWQTPVPIDPPPSPGAPPRPDIWPPPPVPERPTFTETFPMRRGFGHAHWRGRGLVADGEYAMGRTCMITATEEVACFGVSHAYSGGRLDWGHRREQPVEGTRGATRLDVAPDHGCAVMQDGRAACWGDNQAGQLGNGTTDPTVVAAFVTW